MTLLEVSHFQVVDALNKDFDSLILRTFFSLDSSLTIFFLKRNQHLCLKIKLFNFRCDSKFTPLCKILFDDIVFFSLQFDVSRINKVCNVLCENVLTKPSSESAAARRGPQGPPRGSPPPRGPPTGPPAARGAFCRGGVLL